MVRGLLLALVLLTSAVPAGACVFELLHIPHDHADSPTGTDDCPCHCQLVPRVTTAPTAPVVEGELTAVLMPFVDGQSGSTNLPLVQFCTDPPPGPDPARPRYLAVRRLLI